MLDHKSHINHFTRIYDTNEWNGSGSGSYPEHTVGYRKFITDFIQKNNIKTVTDYGCGDWQFSRLIDWSSVNYLGIDCVKSLIDHHNSTYSAPNIRFEYIEQIENFFNYTGDLLLLKDVIQHWLCDEIVYFLDRAIANFNYILITNSCDQKDDWQDMPLRSRPLSCDFFPLKKYNIKKKAHISNHDGNKEISLITKI